MTTELVTSPERYEYAPIDSVFPSKTNPRRHFPKESLDELAASIQAHGIIEPLIVIDRGAEGYEIYAGERRYRAAKMIGLATVPIIVRAIENGEAAVVRLVENIQREDLAPLDLAAGYEQLVKRHGKSVDDLADLVHKSKRSVYATMALLKLTKPVKKALESGEINATVASVLGTLPPLSQVAAMMAIPKNSTLAEAIDIVTNFHPQGEVKKVERAKRQVKKAKSEVKKAKKKLAGMADKKRESERAVELAALVIVTRQVHEAARKVKQTAALIPLLIRAGAMLDDALGYPEAFTTVRNLDLSSTAKRKNWLQHLKDDDVFPAWLETIVAEEYGGIAEGELNAILDFCGLPKYAAMLKEARKTALKDAAASATAEAKAKVRALTTDAPKQSKKAK